MALPSLGRLGRELELGSRMYRAGRAGPTTTMSPARVILRIIYWLAVLAISLVLLILLVKFFESRDESDVGSRASAPPPPPALAAVSPAPPSG